MNHKEELKAILHEMMDGNLQKAIQFLKTTTITDTSNRPQINIIITLCQMITKPKVKDKMSITDTKDLLILCCEKLRSPNESEVNNYLRSLYHLLKHLSDKMCISDLMCICEWIYPDWISTSKTTDEIHDLFLHFAILLHNEIALPNSKTEDLDSLVKCLSLYLRLQKYTFAKQPKLFFQKIQTYACLLHKTPKSTIVDKFFINLFNLLAELVSLPDKETVKEAYLTFMNLISMFSANDFVKNSKYIKNTFELMERLCKFDSEQSDCITIFKSFYYLVIRQLNEYKKSDVIIFKDLRENFEKLVKNYGLSTSVTQTVMHMFKSFKLIQSHIEKTEKDLWIAHLTPGIQIEYIKIFQIIGKVLSKTEYSDSCSNKCKITQAFNYASSITSVSGTFLCTSLRYEVQNIDEIQETALASIKDCLKYIERLKMGDCQRWMSNWKVVSVILFNISSRFYRANNYKLSKFYYYLLSKYVIVLDGLENSEHNTIENCLGTCLHFIALCYLQLKQYRSGLTYLAFAIEICLPLHSKLWQTWSNIKAKANNDNVGNISEMTINYILQNDVQILQQLYPTYAFKPDNMKDLLYLELQYYHKVWSSKIPMNNTCKELFKLCNDPVTRTIALNLTWEKLISLQDQEYIENIEKTIVLLNKKEQRNVLSNQVCLSVLYYIDFQYKSYEVLKKNLSEMNDNVREEKPLKPHEQPVNPNDKCDIIPTYYNNKIENNMHLHKILNRSVELWNKILESDQLSTVKNLIAELNIDSYIKLTAFEYRLQCYTFQMLKIWFLYFQFGKLFGRRDIEVTSISFIIEVIDCTNKTSKDMQDLAENYIKDLIKDVDKLEIVVTYHVNKSLCLLNSNLLQEGLRELGVAEKYLESLSEESSKILQARILHLKSLYLRKPCSTKLMVHDTNFIVIAQNAFTTIAEFYKSGGNKCQYTLSVLFDISLSIGMMYKWLRMSREIRCYTSESVKLAQQMVLPIRTVQFFSLLAFTDLVGCQFDDCKVKLSGIDYIMCYRNISKPTKSVLDQEKIHEVTKEFDKISISSSDNGIEMMLDIPVEYRMKNNQGSPILKAKPFKIPAFLYHLDCSCSYCLNIDYQRLVLECTHLEAVFYMRQNNLPCSAEFFKGGLSLYKAILNKYESLTVKLRDDFIERFKKDLNFTYAKFLMDFAFYYSKRRDFNEAEKINEKIFTLLGSDVDSNTYFYHEIMLQKIGLISAKELENIPLKKVSSTNELTVDYDIFLSKTPENKISVPKFSLSLSPCADPTPKKPVKKHIAFDIFGSDEDKDEKDPEVKNKIFRMKTPHKTPAPHVSKIKIYTPAHSNKIQPINMDMSPKPIENIALKTEASKLPVNGETKLKSRIILEKRTKLLTEKLKAEKKGTLKESNLKKGITDRSKSQIVSKENKNLRKNIMDDISDSDKSKEEKKMPEKKPVLKETNSLKNRSSESQKLSKEKRNLRTNGVDLLNSDKTKEENLIEEMKELTIDKKELLTKEIKTTRSRLNKVATKEPEKTVKTALKRQYKRIVKNPSTSSEETATTRSTRSSKM